jgi:hypothetical protein
VAPRPEPPAAPRGANGYWVVAADGRVQTFGAAPTLGDASRLTLAAPVVAAAATPSGQGYWLAAADGAVFAFGDATFHGSAQTVRLNAPIVGMAATPTGKGYWLLGRDGGIFSFGDASFSGSTGGITLNQPVVDMAPTPTGRGYWLVASDGGVFAFGDARFHGSTGAIRLNRPVVSLTPSTDGGYWMVASDGGIFAFDVPFHGSLPGLATAGLPDGHRIRATPGGTGYYILGANGHVFPFGAAADHGSPAPARRRPHPRPLKSLTALGRHRVSIGPGQATMIPGPLAAGAWTGPAQGQRPVAGDATREAGKRDRSPRGDASSDEEEFRARQHGHDPDRIEKNQADGGFPKRSASSRLEVQTSGTTTRSCRRLRRHDVEGIVLKVVPPTPTGVIAATSPPCPPIPPGPPRSLCPGLDPRVALGPPPRRPAPLAHRPIRPDPSTGSPATRSTPR